MAPHYTNAQCCRQDIPTDALIARCPRTLANLETAVRKLPHVMIFDNDDLRTPFRRVAVFERGRLVFRGKPLPKWLSNRHQSLNAVDVVVCSTLNVTTALSDLRPG